MCLIYDLLPYHSFSVNSQSLLELQRWGGGWPESGVVLFCPRPSAGLIVPSLLCRAPGNWYSCSVPHVLQLGEVRACREGSFFTGLWKPPWPGGAACTKHISCRFCIASWRLKSDAAVRVVLFVLFSFIVVLSVGTYFSCFSAEILVLFFTAWDSIAAAAASCSSYHVSKHVVKHLPTSMACRHFHSCQYRSADKRSALKADSFPHTLAALEGRFGSCG